MAPLAPALAPHPPARQPRLRECTLQRPPLRRAALGKKEVKKAQQEETPCAMLLLQNADAWLSASQSLRLPLSISQSHQEAACVTLATWSCTDAHMVMCLQCRIAGQALTLNGTGSTLSTTSPVFLEGTVTPAAASNGSNATSASGGGGGSKGTAAATNGTTSGNTTSAAGNTTAASPVGPGLIYLDGGVANGVGVNGTATLVRSLGAGGAVLTAVSIPLAGQHATRRYQLLLHSFFFRLCRCRPPSRLALRVQCGLHRDRARSICPFCSGALVCVQGCTQVVTGLGSEC